MLIKKCYVKTTYDSFLELSACMFIQSCYVETTLYCVESVSRVRDEGRVDGLGGDCLFYNP